jgi:MarR family transcriptional regulator, organic hydroperoxide resistance regulator
MSARRKVQAANGLDLDLIIEGLIYLHTESRRAARVQCARVGITATQLDVLKRLDHGGPVSLSQLSERLAATNSTVTGIVDRMEQSGLVVRAQSQQDRRVWQIHLTAKGQELARKIPLRSWDLLRAAAAALAPDEQRTLVALLHKLARHAIKEEKQWVSKPRS